MFIQAVAAQRYTSLWHTQAKEVLHGGADVYFCFQSFTSPLSELHFSNKNTFCRFTEKKWTHECKTNSLKQPHAAGVLLH